MALSVGRANNLGEMGGDLNCQHVQSRYLGLSSPADENDEYRYDEFAGKNT